MGKNLHWRDALGGSWWCLSYNGIWAVCWFTFMQKEWVDASNAAHRPMPWTAWVWSMWFLVTIPVGMAVASYAAQRGEKAIQRTVTASMAIWMLLTASMIMLGHERSWSMRVLVLDSTVNLASLIAAGFVVGWRAETLRGKPYADRVR